MTGLAALLAVCLALPFVLWPLVRGEPEPEVEAGDPAADAGALAEEVELDVATGRLSEAEGARRLNELARR